MTPQEALHALFDEQVMNLSELASDIRPDGLPQDWVDDMPNHNTFIREELCQIVEDRRAEFDSEPQWIESLKTELETV